MITIKPNQILNAKFTIISEKSFTGEFTITEKEEQIQRIMVKSKDGTWYLTKPNTFSSETYRGLMTFTSITKAKLYMRTAGYNENDYDYIDLENNKDKSKYYKCTNTKCDFIYEIPNNFIINQAMEFTCPICKTRVFLTEETPIEKPLNHKNIGKPMGI